MKKTIIDLFENSVKQYPDNPFLWEKTRDAFEPTTYKEVQQQVYAAGAGLIALGVKKGDNMALRPRRTVPRKTRARTPRSKKRHAKQIGRAHV